MENWLHYTVEYSNQKKSPNDTLPITNPSYVSKVFDKILASQIAQHLENHNLIDNYPKFRRSHCTQNALLYFERIKKAIDNKQVVILMLFDFSKAFDSLDHRILLLRLRQIGFSDSALAWVHFYLSGSQQAVIDPDGNPSYYKWEPHSVYHKVQVSNLYCF